jgi:mono/diheme cytochrome c family protein/plastocyanin
MKLKFEKKELLALGAVLFILVGLPVLVLGYQFGLRPALAQARTIDIVVAAPETGGFQPENVRIAAGETVRLRFSVPDVTHGLAIGPGLNLDFGQIDPGQVKEVEVTIDQPGRYTLYCNTWCSPNHWRMRSVIEVYDPAAPETLSVNSAPDPVLEDIIARQIDIDAPHPAEIVPPEPPSPDQGSRIAAELGEQLPSDLTRPTWRRGHTSVDAWKELVRLGLNEKQAWDTVAFLWLADLGPQQRQKAGELYAKNCAACHGETGDGRGPGASVLAEQHSEHAGTMTMATAPTAFADPEVMLGGTGEIYYAKLRRGGMGTSMPSFGQILTPEETWQLVDYLWTFVFDPETEMTGLKTAPGVPSR